jgi:hypothetical protein
VQALASSNLASSAISDQHGCQTAVGLVPPQAPSLVSVLVSVGPSEPWFIEREPSVVDVERRQAMRLRVMKAIFDETGGSVTNFVSGPDVRERLKPSDQEMADACAYLESEGLIKCTRTLSGELTPIVVQITHRGIKEMEQSLQSPREPTRHFPPAFSVVNVQGNVIGSAIQSGSPGAEQKMSVSGLDLNAVREFLREYDAQAADLELTGPAADELAAEIDTVKAQLRSPKPKHHIIRESLVSVRTILEVATGSAAAIGLLDLLKLIHL